MPRSITPSTSAEVEEWSFLKITLPAPHETLRFTDRPGGYTGEIVNGGSQIWVETDFDNGPFSLSSQQVLVVNWIKFANTDGFWSTIGQEVTIRGIPIVAYKGNFNIDTGNLEEAYIEYLGTLDEAEFKEEATFTIKPHDTPWSSLVLYNKLAAKCINDFMNPEDCQFPYTPGLTCAKTRAACREYENEEHINIYDDLPKPNERLTYSNKVLTL